MNPARVELKKGAISIWKSLLTNMSDGRNLMIIMPSVRNNARLANSRSAYFPEAIKTMIVATVANEVTPSPNNVDSWPG